MVRLRWSVGINQGGRDSGGKGIPGFLMGPLTSPLMGVWLILFLQTALFLRGQESPPHAFDLETIPVSDETGVVSSAKLQVPRSGVSASEVGVVVNTLDPQSVAVADYYMLKRGIPPGNRIEVGFSQIVDNIDYADFVPIRQSIIAQTPSHIQVYAITWTQPWLVGGSCLSMTAAVSLGSAEVEICRRGQFTGYYQSGTTRPFDDLGFRPSMMLAGRDQLNPNRQVVKPGVQWVKELIDRSVSADGAFPRGKGYFVRTVDLVRSLRWEDQLATAQAWNRPDALDLVALDQSGNPGFNFSNHDDVLFYFSGRQIDAGISSNRFLPGSVADNVTSFNGVLVPEILPEGTPDSLSSHTSILRFFDGTLGGGVSASYGPTIEPTAIDSRFSRASVFIPAYFGGATVVEAYWKSVEDTYFGNFIGDPLTRPYGVKARVNAEGELIITASTLKPGTDYQLASRGLNAAGPYSKIIGGIRVERPAIQTFKVPFHPGSEYLLVPEGLIQRVGEQENPGPSTAALTALEGSVLEFEIVAADPLQSGNVVLSVALENGGNLEAVGASFTLTGQGRGVFRWQTPSIQIEEGNSIVHTLLVRSQTEAGDRTHDILIPVRALRQRTHSQVRSPDFSLPIQSTTDFRDLTLELSPGDANAVVLLLSSQFMGGDDLLVDVLFPRNLADPEGPYHYEPYTLSSLPADRPLFLMLYSVFYRHDGSLDYQILEKTFEILKVDPNVNQPPVAVAQLPSPKVRERGQSVRFQGDQSRDPENESLEFFWDFGDGATSTEVNPDHVYLTSGDYSVSLVVSDGLHSSSPALLSLTVVQSDPDIGIIRDGQTIGGTLAPPGDADLADFELKQGQAFRLTIQALECCDLQPVLEVYGPDHVKLTNLTPDGKGVGFQQNAHVDGRFTALIRDPAKWTGSYEVSLQLSPPIPGPVEATQGAYEEKVEISWQPSNGAERYSLFRSEFNSPDSAMRLAEDLTGHSFIDRQVVRGVRYRYWVSAVKGGLQSALVDPVLGFAWGTFEIAEPDAEFQLDGLDRARVSKDGTLIVTSRGGKATVWDSQNGLKLRDILDDQMITSLDVSFDRQRVLTGNQSGVVKVWNNVNGDLIHTLNAHNGPVGVVRFSPDRSRILTAGADRSVRMWNAVNGESAWATGFFTGEVLTVSFSPDGAEVLMGGTHTLGGIVQLWDTNAGNLIRAYSVSNAAVTSLAFSPDGDRFLTGVENGVIGLWEKSGGQLIRQFEQHGGAVNAVVFSGDGRRVLTGGQDGSMLMWSALSGKLILVRGQEGIESKAVSFGFNGSGLFKVRSDGGVRFWKYEESSPSISDPGAQIIREDESLRIAFEVDDDLFPFGELRVEATSSNLELLPPPNIAISGFGRLYELALSPVSNGFGESQIELRVTNPSGAVSQRTFPLVVEPVNDPPVVGEIGALTLYEGDFLQTGWLVNDVETGYEDLIFSAMSSNLDLVDPGDIQILGGEPNREVRVGFKPDACGASLITLMVEDSDGATVLTRFRVIKPCGSDIEVLPGGAFGASGREVLVPLKVRRFNDLIRFKASFLWDPSVMELVEVEPRGFEGLDGSHFDLTRSGLGILGIDWAASDPLNGVSMDEEAVLCVLRFQLVGASGTTSSLTLDTDPAEIEVIKSDQQAVSVFGKPGRVDVVEARNIGGSVHFFAETGRTDYSGIEVQLIETYDTRVRAVDDVGRFLFENLAQGGDYRLSVRKASDLPVQRNITTLDLLLIKAHILFVRRMDSPYLLLAADVNRDGKVTTIDVLLIRRLILGNTTHYTQSDGSPDDLWTAIPADLVFTDPLNPWADVTDVRDYVHLMEDQLDQDFLLIKLGDVN